METPPLELLSLSGAVGKASRSRCISSTTSSSLSKMTTYKLHGMILSTCTQKLLFAAYEHNCKVDIHMVNLMTGDQKKPDHMALHPFGKIPVLVEGDFKIYESQAISRYIDALNGNKLVPRDAKKLALVEQWVSAVNSYFNDPLLKIALQRVYGPMRGATPDEAVCKAAADALVEPFSIMNKNLADKQFLAGEFSLADIIIAPFLQFASGTPEGKKLLEDNKNVAAWWGRVASRPAWVKIQGEVHQVIAAMSAKK